MQTTHPTHERVHQPLSGYVALPVLLALLALGLTSLIRGASHGAPVPVVGGLLGILLFVVGLCGLFVVEPNMGRALVLFGSYRGTVRRSGFWFTNPFMSKKKISLRAHNLNGEMLKVNDLLGNPVEIAAVVVWQVKDSAQALFDVEEFEQFVEIQSESALRMVASRHPYDDGQVTEVATTLRGSADEVSAELQGELAQRLAIAGIEVIEARLSHLAYAQEIAAAMLQRQQAGAIIAARQKIVEGAVGMVEMALEMLSKQELVVLDDERRATLVGNLLVVLCGHGAPSPVINTGSLYN